MSRMASKTIHHFTHPQHSLTEHDSNTTYGRYLCDGCKVPGIGKRYHCDCPGCNFDMHEYCATCPRTLSSFMDPHHQLHLVIRHPQPPNRQMDRVCNICCDPVEGLFYTCESNCGFDVHPLCTQLPQTLRHALHQKHPLRLMGSSSPGTCAVCRGTCAASSWRYRCAQCGFDIHVGCVLIQCEKKTLQRGIVTYAPPSRSPLPPQHFGGYDYGYGYGHGAPYWNAYSPYAYRPDSFYVQPNHMPQPQPQPQPQHQNHGHGHTIHGVVGRIGQMMFGIVQTLIVGAISNLLFGMDASP